ncbi:MAG: PocR ligand-binding domain-containing protein [Bacteroidales bacterium]|jgi:two-component system sensor histidine kinase/response regulator|nr:PocR ligand-binding domain-containing protein [Bacteroidales bacterium]
MKYHITELFNIEELRQLCESFTEINGTVTAILDLEGNVLIATGWQPICTQFHRINDETKKRCSESDTILAGKIKQGHKYNIYKCKNGLVDVAIPIMMENEHVGIFFTGQFFTEKPDKEYFIKQARKFGFDEKKYLIALENTPVFSEEQIRKNASFLVKLTESIGKNGLKNLINIEQSKQLEIDKIELKEINEELIVAKEKAEESEIELRESEERYKLITQNTLDVVFMLDKIGKLLFFNESVEKILGYKQEELVGKSFTGFVPKSELPKYLLQIKNVFLKKEIQNFITKIYHKNGNLVEVEINGKLVIHDGKSVALGTIRDMSLRRKDELIIKQKNEELSEINAEKDKFFSIIAHDLKGPLGNMVGLSEYLVQYIKEKNHEKTEKFANMMLKSSNKTVDLLSNLMDWAQSKSGRMDYNPEYFEIDPLVQEEKQFLEGIAEQKSIIINNPIKTNNRVFADKTMISGVLRNLISNAIKFTNTGGKITILAENKENVLTMSINDNGVGISEDNVNKLFQIGENQSTLGTENEKGTGLGLILCKEFIEKNNGKIWVKSKVGAGSSFYFSLPTTNETNDQ